MNRYLNLRYPLLFVSMLFISLISLGAIHPEQIQNSSVNISKSEFAGMDKTGKFPEMGISESIGTSVRTFRSALVDKNNTKWFLTERGILSFNEKEWILHVKNQNVPVQDLKNFAWEVNPNGEELWIASSKGATVAALPIEEGTAAVTYQAENSQIMNNNVVQVAIGKNLMRWIGTAKGVSAFRNDKWLKGNYNDLYSEGMFEDYPITAMATNTGGDSLYVATDGAGIARIYRNDVDAITGASVYARWGPILLPSDKVYSVYITQNNTQWFGTAKGIARHVGSNTLANWTVFSTKDGLPDNFVQAITAEKSGKIWIGTKGGASVYDGSKWVSFTRRNGLNSNNILCIVVDISGVVWFGTDDGVTSYKDGEFTSYR